jgi:alcohol dehydrogenase/propanol-preferring alcohol dehydrogenase
MNMKNQRAPDKDETIGGITRMMRAVQVTRAKGPFELIEREIPQPAAGQVRIKVDACGICHSDAMTKEGLWPGIQYPRVPGHEIAGVIDAIGTGVAGWTLGQRVGVGWHGGHCGYCDSCRRGDFVTCQVALQIPGIAYDGGYAEYMIAPAGALAAIPDGLSAMDAGPLMCAGVTTFNLLRNSGARPGDLVAILGIGGLGHLGIQFAAKMGFKPSRSPAAWIRNRSPGNSAPLRTSTARCKIPPPSCSNWAALRWCSRQ